MFGYFTDLEICLVSEKILLLVFQVIVSGSEGWGGQGCFWTTLGGGGCNSIAGGYSKSGRFCAL